MPKYKITDNQTGKTVTVSGDSAPTEQEAEQIFADAGLRTAAPESATAPKPSGLVDSIRAIPGGLAKGAAGLLGAPRDVSDLLQTAAQWAGDKISPAAGSAVSRFNAMPGVGTALTGLKLPGSQPINDFVSKPFGGYYKPKTTAGEYSETVASFAPAALAPGSLPMRAARVVAPGVASEAAGQAAKGTKFEPMARAGGALLGGLAVGGVEGALARRAVRPPSGKDLRASADEAYKAAENAGVIVSGESFKNRAASIADEVDAAGIDPTLHPKATAALKRLTEFEGDPSLKRLETLRRVVNGAAGSIDKDERRIAYIIRDQLDDFVEKLEAKDLVAGDKDVGVSQLKEARSLWSKVAKNEIVEKAIEKAKNRGETVNGSGVENALRIEFRKIAQNEKLMRRFSKEEQAAIRAVGQGNITANTMRRLGSFAPTGLKGLLASGMGTNAGAVVGSVLGGPVGGMIGGATGGALTAGAGQGAKKIAEAMTMSRARQAGEVMRRGAAAPETPQARKLLIDALLSQQGAHR